MNTKYKVGDKVIVKSLDEILSIGKEIRGIPFVEFMHGMCGNTYEVIRVEPFDECKEVAAVLQYEYSNVYLVDEWIMPEKNCEVM